MSFTLPHPSVQSPLEKSISGHPLEPTEVIMYVMAFAFSLEGVHLSAVAQSPTDSLP